MTIQFLDISFNFNLYLPKVVERDVDNNSTTNYMQLVILSIKIQIYEDGMD